MQLKIYHCFCLFLGSLLLHRIWLSLSNGFFIFPSLRLKDFGPNPIQLSRTDAAMSMGHVLHPAQAGPSQRPPQCKGVFLPWYCNAATSVLTLYGREEKMGCHCATLGHCCQGVASWSAQQQFSEAFTGTSNRDIYSIAHLQMFTTKEWQSSIYQSYNILRIWYEWFPIGNKNICCGRLIWKSRRHPNGPAIWNFM